MQSLANPHSAHQSSLISSNPHPLTLKPLTLSASTMPAGRYKRPQVSLTDDLDLSIVSDDLFWQLFTYMDSKTLAAWGKMSKRMHKITREYVKNIVIENTDEGLSRIDGSRQYKHVVIKCVSADRRPEGLTQFLGQVSSRLDVEAVKKVEVIWGKFSVALEPLLEEFPQAEHVVIRNTVYGPSVSAASPMRPLKKLSVYYLRERDLDVSNLRVSTLEVQRVNIRGTGTVDKLVIKYDMKGRDYEMGDDDPQSCLTAGEVVCDLKNTLRRNQLMLYPLVFGVNNVRSKTLTYPGHTEAILRKEEADEDDDDEEGWLWMLD